MRYVIQRAGTIGGVLQAAWLCLELFAAYHDRPVSRASTAAFALAVLGTPLRVLPLPVGLLPLLGPLVLLWFTEYTNGAGPFAAENDPQVQKTAPAAGSGSATSSHPATPKKHIAPTASTP